MTNQPLEGTVVRLVRLSPDHAEALFPSASDPEVWQWMPRARPETVVQLREWLGEMTADPTRRCFTVQRRDDGTVIGSTSMYDLDLAESRTEIGATWFDRSCWGGPYNVESKLLLFTHAFEDLRLARLALRTDNLNVRSQQALARLGLVHEGTCAAICAARTAPAATPCTTACSPTNGPPSAMPCAPGSPPSPRPEPTLTDGGGHASLVHAAPRSIWRGSGTAHNSVATARSHAGCSSSHLFWLCSARCVSGYTDPSCGRAGGSALNSVAPKLRRCTAGSRQG